MSPRSRGRRHFLFSLGSGALTLALGDVAWASGVAGLVRPRGGASPFGDAPRTVRLGCIVPDPERWGERGVAAPAPRNGLPPAAGAGPPGGIRSPGGARAGGLEDGILLGREESEQVGALLGVELEVLVERVGSPEETGTAVTRLLAAGVQGLVGGVEAPASGEAGRRAAREGIPFVDALPWSASASAPTDSPCSPATFRVGVDSATGLGLVMEALSLEDPSGPLILVGDPHDPHVAWAGKALTQLGWDPRVLNASAPLEGISDEVRSMAQGGASGGARALLVGPTALSWASTPGAGEWGLSVFATTPLRPTHPLPTLPIHAPALWHPALIRFGATQLNERHERRFGTPMGSSAWAGWFAVKLLWEVVLRGGGEEGGDVLTGRLADPATRFDGHKGVGLGFRSDGLLRQPLYLVRTDPHGGSEVVHEGPAAPGGTPFITAFDSLGPPGTPCRSGRVDPARPAPSAP